MVLKKNRSDAKAKVSSYFPTRPSKGELKKIAILNAATQLIATDGLHAVTYDKIAKLSRSTRQLAQTYFPNRDILFENCFKLARQDYQTFVVNQLAEEQNDDAKIYAYIDASFDWIESNTAAASLFVLFHHFCIHRKDYKEINTEVVRIGTDRIEKLLYLSTTKRLTPKEARLLATSIQFLITGGLYASMTQIRTTPHPRESVKSLTKQMLAR